jgi:hypothetical protein
LWKVKTDGSATGAALIDPGTTGENGQNLITGNTTPFTIEHAVTLPALSLAADERLYVQFWRRQLTPYVSVFNNDARLLTLAAHDGIARLEHPAVSTLPDLPALASPVDGAITSSRNLSGVFSDPDAGDSGSLEFRVCTAPAAGGSECSPTVDSGFSAAVANGATASWTASAGLAHGTPLHWQARGVDALGGRSGWTDTRSFTLNDEPAIPVLASPVDGAITSSRNLSAVFSDADAGDSGSLEFRVCTTSATAGSECAPAVDSGFSAAVANGATASWTASAGLGHGTPLHWQARSLDALGGLSEWSDTRSFTLNDGPASPALSLPLAGALVRSASPALRAAYVDSDGNSGVVRFRVCLTSTAAGLACARPVAGGVSEQTVNGATAAWRPEASLRDQTYFWQARSEDAFGVVSPWSATRKLIVARRLLRVASSTRVTCVVGATLRVQLRLAASARVSARLYTKSRFDLGRNYGLRPQGRSTVALRLPYSLERPAVYWIRWIAVRGGERAVASTRLDLRAGNGGPPTCRT